MATSNENLMDEWPATAVTPWRPPQHVKVKALGLHWRDGKLLAAEVFDDQGRLVGVRPLGGGVEFGERWQTALVREFKEELGVDVQLTTGTPLVMENIYTHQPALVVEHFRRQQLAIAPVQSQCLDFDMLGRSPWGHRRCGPFIHQVFVACCHGAILAAASSCE